MKISKLFHWLYASIMFLPLLVAPIFAIYSHRHTIDSYSVTRDKYQVVDFNQLIENGKPMNTNGWGTDSDEIIYYNNYLTIKCYDEIDVSLFRNFDYIDNFFNINDIFILKFGAYSLYDSTDYEWYLNISGCQVTDNLYLTTNYSTYEYRFVFDTSNITYNLSFNSYTEVTNDFYFKNIQLFNLTQMFGSGNEPTIEQFNTWYPNDYYNYTLSNKELLQNGTETLNNTDIGSQFIYAIYNPLNDYFNFNNYLGIGNLYNWMQLNLFKGTAPLGFFIFWELLMYWLLVSLIWLIFDIAMYVPKLAHRWLDKASLE